MKNFFKSGQWNALCDVCGFKFKSGDLHTRWDGLRVCHEDFETRHPSDLLRVPKDNSNIAWARPEPTTTFVAPRCTYESSQGVAGYSTAGCARPGVVNQGTLS